MNTSGPQGPQTISHRLARFIVKRPWSALAIGLLVFVALLPGAQFITADFSYRAWFHADDPLLTQFDEFERKFGNDESVMLVMHSPSGIFDEASP